MKGLWTAAVGAGAIGLVAMAWVALQESDTTRSQVKVETAKQDLEAAEFDDDFKAARAKIRGEQVSKTDSDAGKEKIKKAKEDLDKAQLETGAREAAVKEDRRDMQEVLQGSAE